MEIDEYISREAALDAVFGQFCASSDEAEEALNTAIEEIKAISAADVVEVVWCKDCKYHREDGGYEYVGQADTHVNCTHWLTANHGAAIVRKAGFCSDGEREVEHDLL